MSVTLETLLETGIDGVALKPAEVDVARGADLPVDLLTIDYEGPEHVPDRDTLRRVADAGPVRLTVPVRADGFDPLGDDRRLAALPDGIDVVVVAGHPSYLTTAERRRAIAPRFGAAVERAPDAWVGTEGVERLALATGATQFSLLSPTVERTFRALRSAGFDGGLAVYAPTVFSDDDATILDAVGDYVARRRTVWEALPDGRGDDYRDVDGLAETVLAAAEDYALVGPPESVRERIRQLKAAGADYVVSYPARGLDEFNLSP